MGHLIMWRLGPWLVFAAGAMILIVGLATEDHATIWCGAGLVVCGGLGPRLRRFRAGPTGVEGEMATVDTPDLVPRVISTARRSLDKADAEEAITTAHELLAENRILVVPREAGADRPAQPDGSNIDELKDQVADLLAEGIVRAAETSGSEAAPDA
jgi:hypothetical protein